MDFGPSHFKYILATRISLNGIKFLDEPGNVATAGEIGTYSSESTDRKGKIAELGTKSRRREGRRNEKQRRRVDVRNIHISTRCSHR